MNDRVQCWCIVIIYVRAHIAHCPSILEFSCAVCAKNVVWLE